jgi:glycosyltransferase XagB
MQTYLVHMREPGRLYRDLGPWAYLGIQAFLGGLLLSILVHPLFYALVVVEIVAGELFGRPQSLMGAGFWHLSLANLALGFTASISLGALAACRRGFNRLAPRALLMPVYWLLVSAAAYRALWQLARDPFRWEKTRHATHPGAGRPPQSRRSRKKSRSS